MSEFVHLFRTTPAEQREAMGTPERAQRSLQVWLGWIRELEAGGHLKNPGQPLAATGAVVRGKAQVVTDGPYLEAKDLVLGFLVIEVLPPAAARGGAARAHPQHPVRLPRARDPRRGATPHRPSS